MTRAPRVLVSAVALAQPIGGVRRQAIELLPRVARLLHEEGGGLDLLVGSGGLPEDLERRLPQDVGRFRAPVPAGGPLARSMVEGRALRAAIRAAADRGAAYDLLHVGHLSVAKVPLPFSFLIHDLRDLEPDAPTWRRVFARRLLPATFARAAVVMTVSETMRAELLGHWPELADKVAVVRHGSDHLLVHPRAPGPLDPAGGDPRAPILFLGHLERRRNPMLLVEMLARCPDLPPVLFVGAPKKAEDLRLRARARQLGVEERVQFHGPASEERLPWLLATAGCLVVPSRVEGFGIPALEAQRAGLPLAVARAGALPEVSAPGTPTFEVDDPDACAEAVRAALAARPAQLEAAQRFADGFHWDTSAEQLFRTWRSASR